MESTMTGEKALLFLMSFEDFNMVKTDGCVSPPGFALPRSSAERGLYEQTPAFKARRRRGAECASIAARVEYRKARLGPAL